MIKPIVILRRLLFPISLLYGLIIFIRHKLYDWNVFSSYQASVPTICVGNITVGGTGKTPHVEYLIRRYGKSHKIAVLSRGYGRKTKGFRLVNVDDSAEKVGDEPLQMKQKFPHCTFAVDEKRARGIQKLEQLGYSLILLDDAFQHRAVSPMKSVVLMDYNRLPHQDYFLPSGNLRDAKYALKRADATLITKCPEHFSEQEKSIIINKNSKNTPCLFTHFHYGTIRCFTETIFANKALENLDVLLVTGIANPKPLQEYLRMQGAKLSVLQFADHYDFSTNDLAKIAAQFEKLNTENRIILTTEKDKVKLLPLLNGHESLLEQFHYIPIEVAFENEQSEAMFADILGL